MDFRRRHSGYASSGSKYVRKTLPAGFLEADKENLRPLPSVTMVKPHTMTSVCGSSVGIQVTITPTRVLCGCWDAISKLSLGQSSISHELCTSLLALALTSILNSMNLVLPPRCGVTKCINGGRDGGHGFMTPLDR